MIAKGTTHDNGGRLGHYLVTGKAGEQAELWELRGFASDNVVDAFRSVHVIAEATKAEQPFFHVQVRNPEGETLTREQWVYTADRIERMLGLKDQPRAIAFHIDERSGERHMHVAWSRIDEETLTAKALPFYKDRLKKVSRELEMHFGLTLVPNERPDEIKYAPTRAEDEQARRLGLDAHQVRQTIRACWDRADCGKSFEAALADEGMILAAGDRRDYVVIDQAGGMHALGKRLLDVSAAEVRNRIKDLSREQVPDVDQARAFVQERAAERAMDRFAPNWDRDAYDAKWQSSIADAALTNTKTAAKTPVESRNRPQANGKFLMLGARSDLTADAVLEALTRQRATFTAGDLDRMLAKQVEHEMDRIRLKSQVLGHAEIVRLADRQNGPATRYTSGTVIESEQQVLNAAAQLAANTRYGIPDHRLASTLDLSATIRDDQRAAFARATGPEGLAMIDGPAGTGKSYTLNAIRQAYENAGYRVIGLAPTNIAVQNLAADGFQRAATVHAEIFALEQQRARWDGRTVVMLDEAAMVDTKMMAAITAHASKGGAKLIMVGDDRQFSSIERGGMFGALKDKYGAASLTEITRQHASEDKQAAALLASGKFAEALAIHAKRGTLNWAGSQEEAQAKLVARWSADFKAAPNKSRFVFAYTNADVDKLNRAIREEQRKAGILGQDRELQTAYGPANFATGDRLQFTATAKKRGIVNGMTGSIVAIEGSAITLKLDGRQGKEMTFDAASFQSFRHGYAGTIYKGQGRTIDQTYLYHSEHWRQASSYVALTRHREKAELFVSTSTATNAKQLAWQMGRIDDRRAAASFYQLDPTPVRAQEPPDTSRIPTVTVPDDADDHDKRRRARAPIGSREITGPQTGRMTEHQDWALEQARKNGERLRQEARSGKSETVEKAAAKNGEGEEIDRARFKSDPDYRRSVEACAAESIEERRRQQREEFREATRPYGQR